MKLVNIRFRVDTKVKEKALAHAEELGLSLSEALNTLFEEFVRTKGKNLRLKSKLD